MRDVFTQICLRDTRTAIARAEVTSTDSLLLYLYIGVQFRPLLHRSSNVCSVFLHVVVSCCFNFSAIVAPHFVLDHHKLFVYFFLFLGYVENVPHFIIIPLCIRNSLFGFNYSEWFWGRKWWLASNAVHIFYKLRIWRIPSYSNIIYIVWIHWNRMAFACEKPIAHLILLPFRPCLTLNCVEISMEALIYFDRLQAIFDNNLGRHPAEFNNRHKWSDL